MRRARSLTLAILCVFMLPAAARADGPAGPDLIKLARTVGLSSTQVAQIKKLVFGAQREAIPIEAKLRQTQLDLQELMEAESPPPEKKVAALLDRVGQLEAQVRKTHVLLMLRIWSSMSKAQWDKLRQLQAEHEGRRPPLPPQPPRP